MSRTKHILSYAIPIVILLFFLFGSFFAPHDPTATNIRDKYLPSSAEYPFGTDDFGRCEFSRILEGGKTTLGIVLVGSAIVILLGILFGILLAKTGRRRNILAESILNAVTAIPPVAYLIIFIGTRRTRTSWYIRPDAKNTPRSSLRPSSSPAWTPLPSGRTPIFMMRPRGC